MIIRRAVEADFPAMHAIFGQVVADGDSYVFAADTSMEDARAYWFGPGVTSYVAEEDGTLIGMYKLIANQRDRGAHVANASFMVDPVAGGKGVGKKLGAHCLHQAKAAGYLAMQFNFVVSTNDAAVALWKKLGFSILAIQPKAFLHARLGYVDAYVMHRWLDDIGN